MAFSFKVVEEVGVLSEGANGWQKELNLVSWNDREPKYDIREWDANHEKMRKGVTLTIDELVELRSILNEFAACDRCLNRFFARKRVLSFSIFNSQFSIAYQTVDNPFFLNTITPCLSTSYSL